MICFFIVTYLSSLLFVGAHARHCKVPDMTCNNFSVKRTGDSCTMQLHGPSSLSFQENLQWTQRKEFGVQSGIIIPRVLMRAGGMRVRKWIQMPMEEIEPDPLECSASEDYAKSLRLLPTNELPLSFTVSRPFETMKAKRGAAQKSVAKKKKKG